MNSISGFSAVRDYALRKRHESATTIADGLAVGGGEVYEW
jgi:hypothetical protein